MTTNGQNYPKMAKNYQKWPKMVQNVQENGPNEASNTNTKLPDQKWWKIAYKMAKMGKMTCKMTKNDQVLSKNGTK